MKLENKPTGIKTTFLKVIVLLLLVAAISIGIAKYSDYRAQDDYTVSALAHTLNHREAGDIQSVQKINNTTMTSVYYPTFDSEKINQDLLTLLEPQIASFLKLYETDDHESIYNKSILNIDFNSYQINDRFVSLYFLSQITSPLLAHHEFTTITVLVDLQEEILVHPMTYFKEGYEQILAKEADDYFKNHLELKEDVGTELYQSGITANNDNYHNLIIEKDAVTVVFERYHLFAGYRGEQVVKVHLDKLNDYLIYDHNGVEIVEETPPVAQERKLLAFTFDDGPHRSATQRIVDAFESAGGHATFFMLGLQVEQYPALVSLVAEKGHQIGNHSYNHKNFTKIEASEILYQIDTTNQLISEITGQAPSIVRPTFGAVNEAVRTTVNYPLVNWNIDPKDWSVKNAQMIVDAILRDAVANGIILMHDIYPESAAAIEVVLPLLKQQGYEFVTIDELAKANGIVLQPGESYRYLQ